MRSIRERRSEVADRGNTDHRGLQGARGDRQQVIDGCCGLRRARQRPVPHGQDNDGVRRCEKSDRGFGEVNVTGTQIMTSTEVCRQESHIQDDEPLQRAAAGVAFVDEARARRKLLEFEQISQWAWSNRQSNIDWID